MKKSLLILAVCLFVIVATAMIYIGSRPEMYELGVGDTSPYDIVAPRGAVDQARTIQRALEAQAQVAATVMRSESISDNVLARLRQTMTLISDKRNELYGISPLQTKPDGAGAPIETPPAEILPGRPVDPAKLQFAVSSLISAIDQSHGVTLPSADVEALLNMSQTRFEHFRAQLDVESQQIMGSSVDIAGLAEAISAVEQQTSEQIEFYEEDVPLIGRFLRQFLTPNVVYNAEATENARKAAYERVINNPVMVNRGTRIVTQGDVITEETMALLTSLALTNQARFDFKVLGGQALLVLIITLLTYLFFRLYQPGLINSARSLLALSVTILIPLAVTMLIGHSAPLSPPVYFASVVICAYFGFRTSLFMSLMLILALLPMTGFEPVFALVGLAGATTACLFTRGISKHDNYAKIILTTTATTLLATAAFGLMQKQSWQLIATQSAQTTISAMVSVIAAIGIMPLFELIFNTVSPLRLIELSQPGHTLLKRLFIEAPGTSQHSMMVANLADTAAEAIGANAMIARVGAYYHDIGKLEDPVLFMENQKGENPNDLLTPEESTRRITSHTEDGVRIARRFRLPQPVLRIIQEHHGTTVLQFFYHRAVELAEAEGRDAPDPDQYRYHNPIPSSRESAVVMLADSTEAAMKASDVEDLTAAEEVIRGVVRSKIDQDQLADSELSFADVETIVQAFLQVYAGHFHERIAYPAEPAKRI
jgi:putative nucleotidyltransferase with HDIG domain